MSAMASQITSLTIVYSTVCSRRRSKETSKLCVTGLCGGNSPVTGEFPIRRPSNAKNVSIWWRNHARPTSCLLMTWWLHKVILYWATHIWIFRHQQQKGHLGTLCMDCQWKFQLEIKLEFAFDQVIKHKAAGLENMFQNVKWLTPNFQKWNLHTISCLCVLV